MNKLNTILPSKQDIALLPRFQSLADKEIYIIQNIKQCFTVENELKNAQFLGFDTESKPTFNKGEISTGPHLIQLATAQKAYLFVVNPETLNFLTGIFEDKNILKVGFGLKNDVHLFRKKGIQLNNIIELSKCFSSFGFKNQMGVKNAVALLFQLNFPKSKTISTSNWSRKILTPQQINYAAADAYAAVLVYIELKRLNILPQHSNK